LVKSQDAVILHGAGRGLRFNTAGSHSGFILGNHEPEVQAVLAAVLQPGMTYFDAGANVGFFAMIAARLVGPAGRVICFEPLPQNARQIEYNAGLNGFDNITVRCEALGDSDRTEAFNTSEEPTWGSLSSVGKEPVQASGHIVVQVRTLDSLASALPAPDLIKMDIEGAEVEALPGALATLAAARPVLVVELHRTNQAVLRVLEQLGYVAAVLGGSESVQDVAWDANIVAVPRERAAFLESIGKTPERLVSQ
jgi:FkbM family methyltransferase